VSGGPTDPVLAELQAIRSEVAGLRAELLRRKARSTKRARTRAKVVAREALTHEVSELDIQRAMKRIGRGRR
jgi:hypothetical protein